MLTIIVHDDQIVSLSSPQSLVEDSRESIWLLTRTPARGDREVFYKAFGFSGLFWDLLLECGNDISNKSEW